MLQIFARTVHQVVEDYRLLQVFQLLQFERSTVPRVIVPTAPKVKVPLLQCAHSLHPAQIAWEEVELCIPGVKVLTFWIIQPLPGNGRIIYGKFLQIWLSQEEVAVRRIRQ